MSCHRLSRSPGSLADCMGGGDWASLLPHPSIFSYSSLPSLLVLATTNRQGIQPNSLGCLTYYGGIRLDPMVNSTILDGWLDGGASLHVHGVHQSRQCSWPCLHGWLPTPSPRACSWQGLSPVVLISCHRCNSMISAEHDMASNRSLRPHCSASMWYGTPFIIFELLVLGPWCFVTTLYETCFVKVLLWWVGLRCRKLC